MLPDRGQTPAPPMLAPRLRSRPSSLEKVPHKKPASVNRFGINRIWCGPLFQLPSINPDWGERRASQSVNVAFEVFQQGTMLSFL